MDSETPLYRYTGDDFAHGSVVQAFGKRDLTASDVEQISPSALQHFIAVGIYAPISQEAPQETEIPLETPVPDYDAPQETF